MNENLITATEFADDALSLAATQPAEMALVFATIALAHAAERIADALEMIMRSGLPVETITQKGPQGSNGAKW